MSSWDQPYMPVIETWDRSPGTVLTCPTFAASRIEHLEPYHWNPGMKYMVRDSMGFMTAGCGETFVAAIGTGHHYGICICSGGLGPTDSWYGLQCCGEISVGEDPHITHIDPAFGPVHENAPYSRIPRDYPEGTVFLDGTVAGWSLHAMYWDASGECFCRSYSHIYGAWLDERAIAWYSPMSNPTTIAAGSPGTARIKFSYSPPAPGDVYNGFPISRNGEVSRPFNNPNSLPLGVRQVESMTFQVRHIEAPAGTLDLPYKHSPRMDSLRRARYLNWLFGSLGDVVAEFDMTVPEWDESDPSSYTTKYVTAEIEYPDVTKDHVWILYCTTPRVSRYGGQDGPTSWGYRYLTNWAYPMDGGWADDPEPFSNMPRGYEIAYATCLFWVTFPINFPPMVAVNATLAIETNANGNLFEEDFPTVRTWDGVRGEWHDRTNPLWDEMVDKGWGTEEVLSELDYRNVPTGWYHTTWPFQTDSLEIYESGLLIDKTHYIIAEVPEGSPSPWPTRYKVDYDIVVENSWVRYNSRPLQLNSHRTGDGRYQG